MIRTKKSIGSRTRGQAITIIDRYRKLFLAPPLAVKNQDTSPIQARGFEVVRLEDDRIEPQIYWYDWATRKFSPDPEPGFELPKRHGWRWVHAIVWHWAHAIVWLWQLDEPQPALDRMAVLLIAFLTAFLTVMAVWQIPPSDNPLANVAGKTPDAASAPPTPDASPFATRFGKTVIGGLGGLVVTEVTRALGNQQPSPDTKWFYIVWFILFFFFMLLILGAFRAGTEGLRARIAIARYPLDRHSRTTKNNWERFWDWFSYWSLRLVDWWFSLRVPLLTFLDTFTNLIQGKNQAITRVFADQIIDQQRNVVRTADAIRKTLNDIYSADAALRTTPGEPQDDPPAPAGTGAAAQIQPPPARVAYAAGHVHATSFPSDSCAPVRVNISVLSTDHTNVFYISRTPGSSPKPFGKRSVAWVSVFTGKIRWYKERYSEDKRAFPKIVLFDNRDGTIAGDEPQIHLSSHYQQREGDYDAFIVFPVPWPHRGFGGDYVKGAILISFRDQEDFELLWPFVLTQAEQDAKLVEALQKKHEDHQAAKTEEERRRLQEGISLLKDIQKIDAEIQAAKSSEERKPLQEQRHQKMEALTSPYDPVLDEQTYSNEQRTIEDWCQDDEVRATLREAIAVLGELLRGFNEVIYQSYLDSNRSV